MRSLLPRRLLLLGVLVSGGCGVTDPPGETALVLYVAPRTAPCVGVGPQTCLLVREDPRDDWSLFYEGIEGFAHEPGYRYTLSVLRREIRNPPADGSSVAYRLAGILHREAAPAS